MSKEVNELKHSSFLNDQECLNIEREELQPLEQMYEKIELNDLEEFYEYENILFTDEINDKLYQVSVVQKQAIIANK